MHPHRLLVEVFLGALGPVQEPQLAAGLEPISVSSIKNVLKDTNRPKLLFFPLHLSCSWLILVDLDCFFLYLLTLVDVGLA